MLSRRLLLSLSSALLATAGSAQAARKPEPLAIGQKVPDFTVTDLNGKTSRLSDLQKSSKTGIVSLTFWCSFCHSCRHMEGQLDRTAKTWAGKAYVAAVDASAGETIKGVRSFAQAKGLAVPILMDGKGEAADLFGARVTTTTVVIDGKGILRYRGRFAQGPEAHAEAALQAVLAGKPVPVAETVPRG